MSEDKKQEFKYVGEVSDEELKMLVNAGTLSTGEATALEYLRQAEEHIKKTLNDYEQLKERAGEIVEFDVDAIYLDSDNKTVEISGTQFYMGNVENKWVSIPLSDFILGKKPEGEEK